MRLSLISLAAYLAFAEAQDVVGFGPYSACGMEEFYSSLGGDSSTWERDGLTQLLQSTHRNILNFTNSQAPGTKDVWAAIIDVDAGVQPNTVKLAYSETEIPAFPFGQRGWFKDHLFPILRGVGILGPDVSDIHNIRANSPIADFVRGIKYYGECGVLVRPDTCVAPAEGGADDTCACNRVYTPPASVRGDIARSLMYMDLRYDGSEFGTRDLRLTDCPFQPERDMAYLSQMITWHEQDPPDEAEILRNDKVCTTWQGNRNPFIDHPDLARQLWGAPLPLPAIGARLIYEACEAIPTLAPTFSSNECDLLNPGDVQIWLSNSDEPDTIGMYTFAALPDGFELFVTDNAWDGEKFLEFEGTMRFTAPDGGLAGGSVFGFGADDLEHSDRFDEYQGTFDMSTEGEPIFVYCLSASGDQRPLLAFNYGGEYTSPNGEVYKEGESALPDSLGEDGVVTLPHYDNYVYIGEAELPDTELRAQLRDPANWAGSNRERYGLSSRSAGSGTTGRQSRWALALLGSVAAGLIGLTM